MLRGISDLGMDKTDTDQLRAAVGAAQLVFEVIASGDLARLAAADPHR